MKKTYTSRILLTIAPARAALTVLGAWLLLTGCAATWTRSTPLVCSQQALSQCRQDEGIVFGSVLVQPQDSQTPTNHFSYTVFVRTARAKSIRYHFTALPNQETPFMIKFPAGDYSISSIRWDLPLSPDEKLMRHLAISDIETKGRVELAADFRVVAGQTNYIGELVVTVPRRTINGSRYTMDAREARPAAMEALRNEYGLSEIRSDLMTVKVREKTIVVSTASGQTGAGYLPYYPTYYPPLNTYSTGHSGSGHSGLGHSGGHSGYTSGHYSAPSGGHCPSFHR